MRWYRQFNTTAKEIILPLLECTKQEIHNTIFLTTWQPIVEPVPEQQLRNTQNSQISWSSNSQKSFLPACQHPFICWAWCLWDGIFPLASLGSLPGDDPSQLLHTCSLPEYGKPLKVLDFLATTKNISVLSTFISCQIQNKTATGRKINSILAQTKTSTKTPQAFLKAVCHNNLPTSCRSC